MAEKEKSKRKRTPDPWWQFPQHFRYAGSGRLETLLPHLQGYDGYSWRSGNLSIEIEEIEADQEYRFVLGYNAELSNGSYQATLTSRITQTPPDVFVIEGLSSIALGGLANLVFYLVPVIFISIPVMVGSIIGGFMVLAVLSTPMLLPIFLHLWQRRNLIKRFEQILRHYEVYGPHVTLESDLHPVKRRPPEDAESFFVFEDGILKEKGKQA